MLIKNLQFTRLLKAQGYLREFNFTRTSGKGETIFTVDVTDDRSNRILFHMQKQDNLWKIQPQSLPTWITQKETDLHELIEKEMQE